MLKSPAYWQSGEFCLCAPTQKTNNMDSDTDTHTDTDVESVVFVGNVAVYHKVGEGIETTLFYGDQSSPWTHSTSVRIKSRKLHVSCFRLMIISMASAPQTLCLLAKREGRNKNVRNRLGLTRLSLILISVIWI